MTTQEIIDYYANLLIIQYENKPRAAATIKTIIKNIVMDQLPSQIMNGFDVDTAVGVQLDTIGKYVGAKRSVYSPVGPITLNDDDFRTIIIIATIQNNSGSSTYEIQNLLEIFFHDKIKLIDFQSMFITYVLSNDVASDDLLNMFIYQNLLPRPMAVGVGIIYFKEPYFGMYDLDNPPTTNVRGFGELYTAFGLELSDGSALELSDGSELFVQTDELTGEVLLGGYFAELYGV